MGPRRADSTERQHQILDAAMRVFARLGFRKARMEDIAQEAGVSKGTLYLYFKGKDALIRALLDRVFDREWATLERALTAHEQPVAARLTQLAEEILRHVLAWRHMLPLFYEFYALAARHRAVREALQAYYRRYIARLAELVAEGVARGELRPMDPHDAALSLVAHLEGLILLWVLAPETVDLERQGRESVALLLHGLLAEP